MGAPLSPGHSSTQAQQDHLQTPASGHSRDRTAGSTCGRTECAWATVLSEEGWHGHPRLSKPGQQGRGQKEVGWEQTQRDGRKFWVFLPPFSAFFIIWC